jgi:hypothetical protein
VGKVPNMDATGAIILFSFVAVLVLLGVGGYFVARENDAFGEWKGSRNARRRAQSRGGFVTKRWLRREQNGTRRWIGREHGESKTPCLPEWFWRGP